jgi:DNA ligase-1
VGLSSAQATVQSMALQLALPWKDGRHPDGFWVSEKFDGVRATWDGDRLRFRSGRDIVAPANWIKALPSQPLDGELWLGRGQFEALSGLARRGQADPSLWQQVQYQVFDQPGTPGTFAERNARLHSLLKAQAVPWLRAVDQTPVANERALRQRLAAVLAQGGEGLMLHRADAPWQPGRSGALFKFKSHQDAEAQVLAHLPGKGKYVGMTGALRVRTPEGVEFALGSGLSDAQRKDPPPLGAWVTYRYRDVTEDGIPRFATFVRVRVVE